MGKHGTRSLNEHEILRQANELCGTIAALQDESRERQRQHMQIEFAKQEKFPFGSLAPHDVFCDSTGEVLMKIAPLYPHNAVGLQDGILRTFEAEDEVLPLKAVLRIED